MGSTCFSISSPYTTILTVIHLWLKWAAGRSSVWKRDIRDPLKNQLNFQIFSRMSSSTSSSSTDPNNGYVSRWPPTQMGGAVPPPPVMGGPSNGSRRPPPPPYPGPKWPDLNQQLSEALNQLKYLEEEKKRLQQDNQELRDLCCFLDDDRQRARKLAKEWQKFGRYTAKVMRQEVRFFLKNW